MTSPDDVLRGLGELATSLGPAIRPAGTEELLRSLAETARRLFGAAACSLAMLSADESELHYTIAAGAGADEVTGLRIPSTQGIAGWAVQSGQPIAISDLSSDPRFSREIAEQTGYVPQTILAVPVQTAQRMLGVISLLDRDVRRPAAEQDMALLALFAGQDLAELAATFATLARHGPAERRLALAVLRDVARYAERRSPGLAKTGMERCLRPIGTAPGAPARTRCTIISSGAQAVSGCCRANGRNTHAVNSRQRSSVSAVIVAERYEWSMSAISPK